MMKKAISILLVLVMVMSVGLSTQVLAVNVDEATLVVDVDEMTQIKNELTEMYQFDEQFRLEYLDRGITFDELITEKAELTYAARQLTQAQGNGAVTMAVVYTVNAKLIQQTTSYNCGPTSALQVLYGMNLQSKVSGTTDANKISTLQTSMGTTSSDGTYVYKMVDGLNNVLKGNSSYTYSYYSGSMTQTQFTDRVRISLTRGLAPILHAKTEYLSYYNGRSSGHYISVSQLTGGIQITLKDCNYSSSYYGTFGVTLTEAYKAINATSGRYLICATQ